MINLFDAQKHRNIPLLVRTVQLLMNVLGPNRGKLRGIFSGMTSVIDTSHLVLL
jgi:hypothetical protein